MLSDKIVNAEVQRDRQLVRRKVKIAKCWIRLPIADGNEA
jgi:hypothetical protein